MTRLVETYLQKSQNCAYDFAIVTVGLKLALVKPVQLRTVFHYNLFHIQLDCLLFVMLI